MATTTTHDTSSSTGAEHQPLPVRAPEGLALIEQVPTVEQHLRLSGPVCLGRAYLNLRLFDPDAEPVARFATRLVLNAPHLVIGGLAMYIGFVLYKKLGTR